MGFVYIESLDDAVFLAELVESGLTGDGMSSIPGVRISILGTRPVINPGDYRAEVVLGSRRDFETGAEEEKYSGVKRHTALVVSGIDPRWLRRSYRKVIKLFD